MGGACSAYELEERRANSFSGEGGGKRPLGRSWRRQECNIKMDLQEVKCGVWIGSIWLSIWTSGRHL
jgi:hypothetical protein